MGRRKGALQMEIIIVAVLLLMVLVVVGAYFYKSQKSFGAQYDNIELQSKNRACLAQAAIGGNFFDNDFVTGGDGYPDACEVCRGGDNSKDTDVDGMPDACDNDPNNAPKSGETMDKVCKGTWDKARKQCTRQCYGPPTTCTRQ